MTRLRLHWRLTISTVALVVTAVLFTGTLAAWTLVASTRAQVHELLAREAQALEGQAADLLRDQTTKPPQTWLHSDRRVMLLNTEQRMVVDTLTTNAAPVRPTPAWLEAATNHTPEHSIRIDHDLRLARIHPIYQVEGDTQVLGGWLAISQDTENLNFHFDSLARYWLWRRASAPF